MTIGFLFCEEPPAKAAIEFKMILFTHCSHRYQSHDGNVQLLSDFLGRQIYIVHNGRPYDCWYQLATKLISTVVRYDSYIFLCCCYYQQHRKVCELLQIRMFTCQRAGNSDWRRSQSNVKRRNFVVWRWIGQTKRKSESWVTRDSKSINKSGSQKNGQNMTRVLLVFEKDGSKMSPIGNKRNVMSWS